MNLGLANRVASFRSRIARASCRWQPNTRCICKKTLRELNLQLHQVLSEITGVSGLKILDVILVGERDPLELASLCNPRVRSPPETMAKSLEADYGEEHLFAVQQSLVGYRFYPSLIAERPQFETSRLSSRTLVHSQVRC